MKVRKVMAIDWSLRLHSNRCLPVLEGVEPGEEDFRKGFDANGNLLNLQPGQTLNWDVRNQLREVRPVERDSGCPMTRALCLRGRWHARAQSPRRCKPMPGR